MSNESDVMQPYFFGKTENAAKEVYLRVLKNLVRAWTDTVSSGNPYVFQQDASAQTSHLFQNW